MKTFRWLNAGLALACVCGCEATKVQKPAWLGVNTMLGYPDFGGAFASAKTSPEERDRYFELVSELGSPPVRDLVMSWALAQPAPDGPFDFSISDELVMQAQTRGVDLLALCWGVPRWATLHAAPAGPAGFRASGDQAEASSVQAFDFGVPALEHEQAFRHFVREFVERYDGDGTGDMPGLTRPLRAYEFFQEMEDIQPEEYAHWLRVFYETAKSADPQAVVSLGSLRSPGLALPGQPGQSVLSLPAGTPDVNLPIAAPSGDYPTYLERLLTSTSLSGGQFPYFDVVSFHSFPDSYPGRRPFDESLAYIRSALAARGLSKPVWLTEFGCNAAPGEDDQQAARLVAWSLRARALGIERAYIYCLSDYRWGMPNQPVECLGLVREAGGGQDLLRKPAFTSVSLLLKELSKRPDVTRRDENIYVLAGEGPVAFALWQDGTDAPALQFLTSDWWEVRTLTGQRMKRQGNQVPLTDMPVFVQKVPSPFLEESPFMLNPLLPPPEKEETRDKS